ncbi:hypothetical protein [Chromobacterium vaccinii]|uniref:hypothetical protein n=1 Tax=Chromobacterium vaccinii TaxID=1108595 RepID=UPI000E205D5B|nr:hypothetical protein [Chromobacterium vaccinii]
MRKLLILLGALAAAITVAHPSYKNVNNPDDDNEFSKERLDWVEKAGAENMKFHQQNMELISKQCDTTLTIILAGLGGAFAYIVKALDGGASDFVLYGVIAVAVLLTISGTILLIKCMMIDEFPAPTNEPNNLMIKGLDFDGIRKAELENLNIRIKWPSKGMKQQEGGSIEQG